MFEKMTYIYGALKQRCRIKICLTSKLPEDQLLKVLKFKEVFNSVLDIVK